jgi:hypothetical protein
MTLHFPAGLARRRFAAIAVSGLCGILLTFGCSGKHGTTAVQNDEPPAAKAPMASSIKMGDVSLKDQLTKGFYAVEDGAWRWTAGNFSVVLKTPPGAAQKGATLTLTITTPESTIKQLHNQSLTAAIGSTTLKTEKYQDPGVHTFTADVPAASLTGDTVTIDFSLDNALPPGSTDRRELGVIANAISIDAN